MRGTEINRAINYTKLAILQISLMITSNDACMAEDNTVSVNIPSIKV